MPATIDSGTKAVLMIVDDRAEAQTITAELRRAGVRADVVNLPVSGIREV